MAKPKAKRGAKQALFAVIGYINGKKTSEGSASGRSEASVLAEEMRDAQNSLTVGIYNKSTGALVGLKKPKVCRSGKRF